MKSKFSLKEGLKSLAVACLVNNINPYVDTVVKAD